MVIIMIKPVKEDKKMDVSTTAAVIVIGAISGAIGWLKMAINKNSQSHNKLCEHVYKNHMNKQETKDLVELISLPTIAQITNIHNCIDKLDKKMDTMLMSVSGGRQFGSNRHDD